VSGILVIVRDMETGEEERQEIPANDYVIVCAGTCYVAHTQAHPTKGTQVLTIKGRGLGVSDEPPPL
jgi:hypothetical protein